MVELEILKPGARGEFSPGDVRRARWVRSLDAIPEDHIRRVLALIARFMAAARSGL